MAITAKRFSFLDQETNLSTSEFFNANNKNILNSPNNELKTASIELEGFISDAGKSINSVALKAQAKATEAKEQITGLANSPIIRDTKAMMSKALDLTGLSTKDLDGMMGKLSNGNNSASSAFSQLSPTCKRNAARHGGAGRPYDPSVNCGGKKRPTNGSSDCASSSNQFGSGINKLSNGAFNSSYNDPNSILASIMGLSSAGYDMNMCGVFSSLSSMLGAGSANTNLLSRASSGLLGKLTSTGNTMGVLDLASGSAALHPLLENPSGISSITNSFKLPSEIKQGGLGGFSDRFTGALDLFDSDWNKSSQDGILSNSLANDAPSGLFDMFDSKMKDNIFSEDNLDMAPSDDFSFMTASLGGFKNLSDFSF